MRIYEGSPRQNWEEVLRSIGAFADSERLKELLILELEAGFVLQGLALPQASVWAEGSGVLAKRTYELTDDQIGELLDARLAARGGGTREANEPQFYERALRVVGAWIDDQRAHDVFLFEQEGSFVVRLFGATGSPATGHSLAEFTRDDITAMIERASERRQPAPERQPTR
jgi:hypothetical protein